MAFVLTSSGPHLLFFLSTSTSRPHWLLPALALILTDFRAHFLCSPALVLPGCPHWLSSAALVVNIHPVGIVVDNILGLDFNVLNSALYLSPRFQLLLLTLDFTSAYFNLAAI